MPYGINFLKSLDGILMDSGATSAKVKDKCSQCQTVYPETGGMPSSSSKYDISIYNMCNKCAEAKIVNYPDFSLSEELYDYGIDEWRKHTPRGSKQDQT